MQPSCGAAVAVSSMLDEGIGAGPEDDGAGAEDDGTGAEDDDGGAEGGVCGAAVAAGEPACGDRADDD